MKCRWAPGSAALALLSNARGLSQTESQPWTTVGSPSLFCGIVDERSQSRVLGQESNPRQFDVAPRQGIEPPTMNHTYAYIRK